MPNLLSQVKLRTILIVPFVLQIVTTVGLVGYLSFKNGQTAVNDLANQLMEQVSDRVDQQLDSYLSIPHQINQNNLDDIKLGLLDLHNYEKAGRIFARQVQLYNVSYIGYALKTGEYAASGYISDLGIVIDEISPATKGKTYTYKTDRHRNRTEIARIYDRYEPLKESWYTEVVKAGKEIWTSIYNWDEEPQFLAASINAPIYDNNNKFIGVIGVDLLLSNISDFLHKIELSPTNKIFIIERNGLLIASSSIEKPFKMVNGTAQRLSVGESSDRLIQKTAQYLQEKFGNFKAITYSQQIEFYLARERQFVRVTPWQDKYGLDWLVVVVVPERDFMAQINTNTYTTILLCVGALAVATVLGIYTARWITLPIMQLNQASAAIASGDLEHTVEIKQIKELKKLAQSFNAMAGQLQTSFNALETTNEELEQRVTERTIQLQEAKEAADAANEAKSEFIANMSHELRTPLNGILGYAQILQRDRNLDFKQKIKLNIISQCGTHLLTLINDTLDIAKIDARKLELVPTDFHFENFLESIYQICRVYAEEKDIVFEYQKLNRLPVAIHTDEKRLRQVLLNLIGNAIKFTDTGSVKFSVEVKELSSLSPKYILRFQVEDTGIGIKSEQLEQIFLPFEQVSEDSHKSEGTGLGLAISCKLLEMMGSELEVESRFGIGSKFWFELELIAASNAIASTVPQPQRNIVAYEGKRRTILVVDDRWENRSILIDLLEPLGFKMLEASNGQEGIEKAIVSLPDLIITDLVMPTMDGFAMTKHLRQSEQLQHIPIIASSASVFNFNRQQSQEVGCNDFLAKPIQTSELFKVLQHYLELTWIYKMAKDSSLESAQEMIIPPATELTTLYQAAKAGYILEIQAEVDRLKQLVPQYTAFANKISELVSEYETDAIAELIQPYLR